MDERIYWFHQIIEYYDNTMIVCFVLIYRNIAVANIYSYLDMHSKLAKLITETRMLFMSRGVFFFFSIAWVQQEYNSSVCIDYGALHHAAWFSKLITRWKYTSLED